MKKEGNEKYIIITYIESGKKYELATHQAGFIEAMAYTYSRHNGCEIIKMEIKK